MNDLTSRNLLADAPGTNLFLEALARIDKMLPDNVDAALQALEHALVFAMPADRHVCDMLVRNFTRMRFEHARESLARYARAHPELEQQIACCVPDTDPRLHYRPVLPDLGFTSGLDAVDAPRPSLRYAYRRPRDTAIPQRATALRMHAPDAVAARLHARTRRIIVREIHSRGSVEVRTLIRAVARDVLASDIGSTLRRLEDDGIVHRPQRPNRFTLTARGQSTVGARLHTDEPAIVGDYITRSMFKDWQAALDRARRLGKSEWERELTSEVPIRHDQAALRAAREMIRPLRTEAETAAAARAQARSCDPVWRTHLSSLPTTADRAEFWDRLYLSYVTEQLDREATYADKRSWQPRQTRLADATRAATKAFRQQNARYTRPIQKVLTNGFRQDDAVDTRDTTISPELTTEIAYQFADASVDARPRAGDDDTTTRASMRTGIWISIDYRDSPEHRGDGIEVDYSKAAKAPVRGWRCVWCFIERSSLDAIRPDGRSDDGLCEYCRADGHPGIPPLPEGFTSAEVVTAHCQFLAATYPEVARSLLRDQWRRAGKGSPTAATVAEFMVDHNDLPGERTAAATTNAVSRPRKRREPVTGKGLRLDRCKGCFQNRGVNKLGYCTRCRVHLGHITTAPPRRRSAA